MRNRDTSAVHWPVAPLAPLISRRNDMGTGRALHYRAFGSCGLRARGCARDGAADGCRAARWRGCARDAQVAVWAVRRTAVELLLAIGTDAHRLSLLDTAVPLARGVPLQLGPPRRRPSVTAAA